MNFDIFDTDTREIQRLCLLSYGGDNIYIHGSFEIKRSIYKGRNLVIPSNRVSSPNMFLDYVSRHSKPKPDSSTVLWFAPECKMPRDLFRGSGYIITRNKDKAAYKVIPKPESFEPYRYNFIVVHDNYIKLIVIIKRGSDSTIRYEDVSGALKFLKQRFADSKIYGFDPKEDDISYTDNPPKTNVYFVRKCDEYDTILSASSYDDMNYVYETDIPLTPKYNISPETLHMWMNLRNNMLEDTIMQSDVSKYPFTVCCFLGSDHPLFSYFTCRQGFKAVLRSIGFSTNDKCNTFNRIISADDWNMCQKWQMYKLGLPEEGGMTDKKHWLNSRNTEKLTRQRLLVKPEYVTKDIVLGDMLTDLENRN